MHLYSTQTIGLLLFSLLILFLSKHRTNYKIQNIIILFTSLFFYALWDWRFLFLLVFVTALNFFIGKAIASSKTKSNKRNLLISNIVLHVLILFIFRYFNFFIDHLAFTFSLIGIDISIHSIQLILPVGISIYTLQALSYTIEIFKDKIQPTKDIISFSAYVCFFPTIIAGPIERATTLLPQFNQEREINFNNIKKGLANILWGLFKIFVIANNCSIYSNEIFSNYDDYTGISIFMGLASFAFQFYAEFSGLSDIAIGIAKIFGFKLSINFKFPYFSRNLYEFWNKWNISLLEWLKEYIFIPIGGTEGNKILVFRNLFILFLFIGLWHGGFNFIILFGLINAILTIPFILRAKVPFNTEIKNKRFPGILDLAFYFLTFLVIVFSLTLYRADSITDAKNIFNNLFTNITSISIYQLRSLGNGLRDSAVNLTLLAIYIIIEWTKRNQNFALDFRTNEKPSVKYWILIIFVISMILFHNQIKQGVNYFYF